MDHSVKSIVLLQDQLLQIFFDDWISNQSKPAEPIQPKISKKIIEQIPIKETEREAQLSNESNNIEVHNVFDGDQSSLESVLSKKEVPLESPKKKESEEEMDVHDIYEVRDSQQLSLNSIKKNVMINLKRNKVLGIDEKPKSRFGMSQLSSNTEVINSVIEKKSIKKAVHLKEMPKVRDRLTILIIAYHNFAVELEYLGI
jgi:hypothetical protein